MAIHYSFVAFPKVRKSVPCEGNSLSLAELKDAIAAPLVGALCGKSMRETFDIKIYDSDTKEELLDANSRIRNNATVLAKRVPFSRFAAQTLKTNEEAPISPCHRKAQQGDKSNETTPSSTQSEVINDNFGDNAESTVQEPHRNNISKKRASSFIEAVGNKRRIKEESVGQCKQIPKELTCSLCNNVMNDPVLISCCYLSFCSNCIKIALTERKKCPNCGSCKCVPASLLFNRQLDTLIEVFVKSTSAAHEPRDCIPILSQNQIIDNTMIPLEGM